MARSETWQSLARNHPVRFGARGAMALAFVYAFFFFCYALTRSSIQIVRAADSDILATLLASGTSMLLSCLGLMLIVLVAAIPLGAVTALLIDRMLWLLRSLRKGWQGALLGLGAAVVVQRVVHGLLQTLLNFSPASVPAATYLFWLGLPAAIHVVAAGTAGWYFVRSRREGELRKPARDEPARLVEEQ
jgi:hypothetical protein